MSRPILFVCLKCERKRGDGQSLHDAVRALRREQDLKPVFKVEGVKCLDWCDTPCVIKLKGPKRSTYTRVRLSGGEDAPAVVRAAVAYAQLEPGQELPERALPGDSAD